MNQTPNIIPDLADDAKTLDELMPPAGSIGEVVRFILDRINALHLDPSKYTAWDARWLIRNAFEFDEAEGRYTLSPYFTLDDLDEALTNFERTLDTMTGCDKHGTLVRKDGHHHEAVVGTVGVFEAVVSFDDETGRWIVDTYAETIVSRGQYLAAAEALEYAEALNIAARAAQQRNEAGRLRRPVDYCAEPTLDGRGGGL